MLLCTQVYGGRIQILVKGLLDGTNGILNTANGVVDLLKRLVEGQEVGVAQGLAEGQHGIEVSQSPPPPYVSLQSNLSPLVLTTFQLSILMFPLARSKENDSFT
jgi:hypothetical protein